ncbi:hypothetical protein T03_13878 [Trichinella britovi]|uniref:Uncharacterized protein n=1 Tax=Trichinella britovi TaxID=45882 RepID=A0A0V1C7F2_TRIBR|nr:hypothetical protein T03_12888 [Trichinella britovi]KRY43985.1 hypothetical protein T03_13751 [Trichinella britovi]KRY45205.1 hypothetical protein T03_13878 [Trichinella britovi]
MCLMSSSKGIDIWLEIGGWRKSPRISRFSLFLCFDKIAFTNSSDVTKDAKISDKGLCNTFIKLLEQSRILSNWRKQALNDHSYLIPEFIDPHSTLSLYRPLRASHRPQGVDIDHFGYP